VQGIPENRNAWHAGDGGSGEGNRKGLSVEICYSKSGGQRFIDAEKMSARFIAFKLNEKGWGIDKVKKHQDFSGKYCPHRTLDMGWQRFLNMVQAELDKFKGGINMGNQTKIPQINNNKPSEWAKEAWEWAKKEGYLDGTRPHDPITREEMAIIIQRLVKNIG
jgi:N-acetylmuramoyl-L-alanine amidase CwlA